MYFTLVVKFSLQEERGGGRGAGSRKRKRRCRRGEAEKTLRSR